MAKNLIYNIGKASVSAGGTTVSFSGGPLLLSNAKAWDRLTIVGHYPVEIASVDSDTALTLAAPWPGGNVVAGDHIITNTGLNSFAAPQVARDVVDIAAALGTEGYYVYVAPSATAPNPRKGDEGQYALQPTTGKLWVKQSSAWVYLGVYKAFGQPTAWSSSAAYSAMDVVTISGSSYVCVLAHTNHAPPNTTYWQLLAAKGDTGATGPAGASYAATSSTSLVIEPGPKTLTTQAGLAYVSGSRVRLTPAAGASNYMEGICTSYIGPSLTVSVSRVVGGGTFESWNISLTGDPGSGDLSSAANLSDLPDKAIARNNLGAPLRGYLYGVGLSNSATDATNDINFAAGECASESASPILMAHPSGTAQLDVAYGSGSGGRFDASISDGTWHCFVASNGTTVSRGFSKAVDPTGSTYWPPGYTHYRRVGSIIRSGGAIIAFVQSGNYFNLSIPVVDYNATNSGTSALTTALTVPTGIRVMAEITLRISTSTVSTNFFATASDLSAPDFSPSGGVTLQSLSTAGTYYAAMRMTVMTNTSGQIRSRQSFSDANTRHTIVTIGWYDGRGA